VPFLFVVFILFLEAIPNLGFAAPLSIVDADGYTLVLQKPAQRIVTLAPHLTETLVKIGAKNQIVAVSDDHDERGIHPTSVSGFPVISDAVTINYERVRAANPDLVLAWGEGTPKAWIAQLRQWKVPVFVVGTKYLNDMPTQIEQLGQMTGHEQVARQEALDLRTRLQKIKMMDKQGKPRLRYFLQIWRQPLYSLQADHLLSQALALCGADNILPASKIAAPMVNPEFVIKANPDVIFVPGEDVKASQAYWQRFPQLKVVKNGYWLPMGDSRLTRPGAGMIEAVEPVCEKLQTWR
jgi:ABC-type Fe3+-hydroxamate transport system substrate-binding protein